MTTSPAIECPRCGAGNDETSIISRPLARTLMLCGGCARFSALVGTRWSPATIEEEGDVVSVDADIARRYVATKRRLEGVSGGVG